MLCCFTCMRTVTIRAIDTVFCTVTFQTAKQIITFITAAFCGRMHSVSHAIFSAVSGRQNSSGHINNHKTPPYKI